MLKIMESEEAQTKLFNILTDPETNKAAVLPTKTQAANIIKKLIDEPLESGTEVANILDQRRSKDFDGIISKKFRDKVAFDEIPENYITSLTRSNYNNLVNISIEHSDAFVLHSEDIEEEHITNIKNSKKPCLLYSDTQDEKAYVNFYEKNLI